MFDFLSCTEDKIARFCYTIGHMKSSSTIAAVATPPGEGGVAIIRVSGSDALDIANRVFSKTIRDIPSHTAVYGKILNSEKEIIDHVLVLPMVSPRSYTGEDTVEIHCHGGRMAQKVLDVIFLAGAQPAGPGEFTYRAFSNGKLDLTQAEAVQSLIGAQNDLALQAAKNQLEGTLSKTIQSFQHELAHTAAILEAWVDFPEEGLEFATTDEIVEQLKSTLEKMQNLHKTFHHGQKISEGLTLCLIGAPNVGKSSLMNALLKKDRAIVTSQAGTTRDTLDADLHIGSLHFRLTDTAGIRETTETIEQEGVKRSKAHAKTADCILFVLDTTRSLNADEKKLLDQVDPAKTIICWNKIDLQIEKNQMLTFPYQVNLSAKTGLGLGTLETSLEKTVFAQGLPDKNQLILTQKRHFQALTRAITELEKLIAGLQTNISCEFLASDMRTVLLSLSQICGTDVTEDVLDAIFSTFCVGK